jgi:hypothetical protein
LSPSIAMIVASREMAEGPADIALAICSASVFGLCPCALAAVERASNPQKDIPIRRNELGMIVPDKLAQQPNLEERTETRGCKATGPARRVVSAAIGAELEIYFGDKIGSEASSLLPALNSEPSNMLDIHVAVEQIQKLKAAGNFNSDSLNVLNRQLPIVRNYYNVCARSVWMHNV